MANLLRPMKHGPQGRVFALPAPCLELGVWVLGFDRGLDPLAIAVYNGDHIAIYVYCHSGRDRSC